MLIGVCAELLGICAFRSLCCAVSNLCCYEFVFYERVLL